MIQRFDIGCLPRKAFDDFTNPERIVEWWGDPENYRTKLWTADLCEGGRWCAEFESSDGTRFGAEGKYLVVDRPTRLDWTWKADWEPDVEKTIRMSFEPSSTGTILVIETSGYQSKEAEASDDAAWVNIIHWFTRTIDESNGRH